MKYIMIFLVVGLFCPIYVGAQVVCATPKTGNGDTEAVNIGEVCNNENATNGDDREVNVQNIVTHLEDSVEFQESEPGKSGSAQ